MASPIRDLRIKYTVSGKDTLEIKYLDRMYIMSIRAMDRPMKTSTSSEIEVMASHVHAWYFILEDTRMSNVRIAYGTSRQEEHSHIYYWISLSLYNPMGHFLLRHR